MRDGPRFERLEELFHRLVDLPEERRQEVLGPLRDSEPALCDRVQRLLSRADRDGGLSRALVPSPFDGVSTREMPRREERDASTSPLRSSPPAPGVTQVGAYRLIELLGRGGMGEVYLAERADGHYDQTVAVKLIRTGFVTSERLQRFRFERQILARLEHSNIARLLDGAVGEDGLPYLVMEHVQGRPITDYCDAERLDLRARLRLFRTVCRAVQYAHQNLIVHRDLKPSNILVTASGEVKLLDFGIAKLLKTEDQALAQMPTQTMTQTMQPVLTPQYASPEQVRGEVVTTATDVYALGLLLHELLCGTSAQAIDTSSLSALERSVCEVQPPPPSEALASGEPCEVTARAEARGLGVDRLQRLLRGDLDTIVATAIRKDPRRRYASAEQLGDDVQRHLGGLPVLARPDTFGYRAGKLLRRHRIAASAAAAVLLAVAAGLFVALVGLARARQAERRALDEAATSDQVSEFLVDLFRINEPGESMGREVTARELLDRGAERIVQQLADQPAVQARLLGTMARAYEALGLFEPALSLLDRRLELERSQHGAEARPAGRALLQLAALQGRRGSYPLSLDLARQALAIFEQDPSGVSQAEAEHDLTEALEELGKAHGRLGQLDEAGVAFERALAIKASSLGPDDRSLWSPLNNLAIVRWMQGDAEAARTLYGRSLAIAESAFGPDHPSVAHTANNLALAHRQAGDLEQAMAAHERALAIRERVLAPDHPDIAESLNNLGDLLVAAGEYGRAQEALERALEIRERSLGADHDHIASTLTNLGLAKLGLGQTDAAEPLLERSLAMLERALGGEHALVSYPLDALARIDAQRGDLESAESRFRRAIAIREARLGEGHPDLVAVLQNYATLLREQGRTDEVEAVLLRIPETAATAGPEP